MCINNKDYIGTIREVNDMLVVKEEKIKQEQILINELKAMRDNPNRTLLDMQRLLDEHYPSKVHKDRMYDYLYPINYNSSYVSNACYPKMMTPSDYLSEIADKRKQLQYENIDSPDAVDFLNKLREKSEDKYKVELSKRERIIETSISEYKTHMKKMFQPERFIYAYNYFAKLREICNDDNLKLFSTDCLGWSDFEYKINDDITVIMKTNFGYGASSYFFSNIIYKGVSILPYTAVIKYYYVKWTDFIRYTNKYSPNRDCWEYALNFVAEVANMAKKDPETFLRKWVVNELKEMMTGLRKVMDSDDAELKKYLSIRNEESKTSYSLVRNCYNTDIQEYNVRPIEKVMAFRAEKITGCLYLLENLRKFSSISSYINKCIEEIKEMNRRIIPNIVFTRASISADIIRLQKKLDTINSEIQKKTPILENHRRTIQDLIKSQSEDNKRHIMFYSFSDYESKYITLHPEYGQLKKEVKELEQDVQEKKEDIRLRQNFDNQLNTCLKRINTYLGIAC